MDLRHTILVSALALMAVWVGAALVLVATAVITPEEGGIGVLPVLIAFIVLMFKTKEEPHG